MKLGMFMMPLHPPGRSYPETLREDREAVLLADRLGYEEAFIGEHVTDRAETVTSCLMFLASLAHETKRIKLGSGTINMPNSHPANVAAQVAMIDNMLEGRFIMGISPGGLMSDAEVFGNYKKDRNAMFVECIDMVLKIWEGEPPYNLKGQFWEVSTERTMIPEIGQGAILKPYQKPHPPIVGTVVAPYSKGVTAMGERGWGPISANFLLPEWVKTHWPNYVEGRRTAGHEAQPSEWRVAKSIFVADDEATARSSSFGSSSVSVTGGISSRPTRTCRTRRSRPSTSPRSSSSPARSTASSTRSSLSRNRSANSAPWSTRATTGWIRSSASARWS
jgi:alkanesulfonate monooxygenase SsuD/methylene tetrahydromethanopterin reductase-like flavin-dependent oxidoreductase (luciferase family)